MDCIGDLLVVMEWFVVCIECVVMEGCIFVMLGGEYLLSFGVVMGVVCVLGKLIGVV